MTVFLWIMACSDSEENFEIQVGGEPQEDVPTEPSEEPAQEQTGESLYVQYCSSCHGEDGTGGADAPGVINHLDDTDEELLDIIINGFGRMEGIPLSEEKAVQIIDYMRAEFGG